MVGADTPKICAISSRGIPRSTAASTLSLRSFEYGFMPRVSYPLNPCASRCSMKRPIFVRPLSDAECETLEAGLRSPDAFTLRRCQILLASNRGKNAYQIAHELGCNP
jgi:hypothetical protein